MIKFSEETKDKIKEEYNLRDNKGERVYSLGEIAKSHNYSIDNVGSIIAGFDSYDYYEKDLLDKLEFQYLNNFQKWSFRQLGFSRGSNYLKLHSKGLGFDSYDDFEEDIIKTLKFNSSNKFKKYLHDKIGFESLTDYNKFLIQNNNR